MCDTKPIMEQEQLNSDDTTTSQSVDSGVVIASQSVDSGVVTASQSVDSGVVTASQSVDDMDAELFQELLNQPKPNPLSLRSCTSCNRYLKKTWRGDTCSKCQFKKKYHQKVMKSINNVFVKDGPKSALNPFLASNNRDFNNMSDNSITLLYKLLDMYKKHDDTRESLIKRLEFYKKMYNDNSTN